MRLSDGLIGAGFVMAGAAVFATTLGFPRQEGGAPGPALFPQVLAVLMAGFGACLAVPVVVRRASRATEALESSRTPGRRGVLNALAVFAGIIAFMLLAPWLGFLLTTAAILFGLTWWLGSPALRAALASVGLTLFVYVIFGKVLRVPLPLGLFWF